MKFGDNPWRDAVTEACVANCIGWDEANPMKTLADLVRIETTMALDPAISKAAQDLIERGRQEATAAVQVVEPVAEPQVEPEPTPPEPIRTMRVVARLKDGCIEHFDASVLIDEDHTAALAQVLALEDVRTAFVRVK